MDNYEMMYITDPANEESVEDVKKRIEGIITGREGQVVSYEKIGKKRLAYPIQKRQYGIYFQVNFKGDGRIVQALDYFLRLNPLPIRHLILKLTDKQIQLKDLTEKIQREEAERMRRGGRPLDFKDLNKDADAESTAEIVSSESGAAVEDESEKIAATPKEEEVESEDVELSSEKLEEDVEVEAETSVPDTSSEPESLESGDEKLKTSEVEESNEKTVE